MSSLTEFELDLTPSAPTATSEELEREIAGSASWFSEGDGSFSLAAPGASPPWHLYGMLYDDSAGVVRRVELKGNCPLELFQKIHQRIASGGQCGILDRKTGNLLTLEQTKQLWNH
jgi:hypothetical protein